jgi:uncharacterized protein YecA (UPF0149 family)
MVGIYNLFDLYVQYAICEGMGMPQIEAAACGVPIMSTNYSAMEDAIVNTGGYPIRVAKMFREIETMAYRAYPDNEDLADKLVKFFTMPEMIRKKKSFEAREMCIQRYSWKETAEAWANKCKAVELTGLQGKWDAPPRHFDPAQGIPEGLTNAQYVDWAYKNITNDHHRATQIEASETIRMLNFGTFFKYGHIESINPESIDKKLQGRIAARNHIEQCRTGQLQMVPVPFLDWAHQRYEAVK